MTLSEIRDYVLDRLGGSSGETTRRIELINGQVNREYQRLVAREQLAVEQATLVFTANDPLVDLPPDLLEIADLRVGGTVLASLTRQEAIRRTAALVDLTPAADEAPSGYVFEAPTRIRVIPTPAADTNNGAVLWYVPRPAALTADTDEPDLLPEQFHDLLGELVVRAVAQNEEALDLAAGADQAANRLLRDLRQHITARTGLSELVIRTRGLSAL